MSPLPPRPDSDPNDPGDPEGPRRRAEVEHELSALRVMLEMRTEELRAAQVALQQGEKRYEQLFALAPVGYLTMDRHGRVEEANRAIEKLLGAGSRLLLARRLSAFMTETDGDVFHLYLRKVFSSDDRVRCALWLRTVSGVPVPVRLESVRVPLEGLDEGEHCRTVVVDLTEQERARSAQRSSQERLRMLAEHIGDVLYVRDRSTLTYVSPAWAGIWGHALPSPATADRLWRKGIDPQDRTQVNAALAGLQVGDRMDEEYRVVRPNGSVRWVRDRAESIDYGETIVGVVTDITAKRDLRERLQSAQRMEAVGTLASGIAHDFNNLLAGVIGCVQRAQDLALSPSEAAYYLREAEGAARRGSDLIARLSLFGRSDPDDVAPLAVDRSLRDARPLLDTMLGDTIILEVEHDAPRCTIGMSHGELEQILLNLASNARDAMPEGGVLRISTRGLAADGSHRGPDSGCALLVIEVRDTGTGMDDETRQRLFEPFFTTKEVGQGTGLGLSTVYETVRRLGGTIDVESKLGSGALFRFELPCCRELLPPSPDVQALAPARIEGTVLLVEDERLVRMTARHYLEEIGLMVLEADGPDAALALAAEAGPIDLLVSDVAMPGGTGPMLARRLRESRPDLKMLFMSGHPRAELLRRGSIDETMPLIEKPFGEDELASAIRHLLADTPTSEKE